MGYVSNTLFLTLLCLSVTWITAQDKSVPNTPTRLDDGLLLTGGEPTRAHIATWTILVTISVPTVEHSLLKRLAGLKQLMPADTAAYNQLLPLRQLWDNRINEIEETIRIVARLTEDHHRQKRGLINIVGTIANKLFGVATEEQVKQLQVHLEQTQVSNAKIYHAFNDLVSVVNHTHDQMAHHRAHINQLEDYASQLRRSVNQLRTDIVGVQQMINGLNSRVSIGQLLSAVEAVHYQWLRRVDQYQRQRASLETGTLTEDILPPIELQRIIDSARQAGLYAPRPTWYYEHVSVTAMWEDPDNLVFRAELPFTDNTPYLRYHLRTWPIPTPQNNTYVQLDVPAHIAIHTATGGLFEPTMCQGRDPAICRTGPIYHRPNYPCPRAILSQDTELQKYCPVTLSHVQDHKATQVFEITPGTYVIITNGESYSIFCIGHPETRQHLTAGAYLFPVAPNCKLAGSGWTAPSILSRTIQTSSPVAPLAFPPLNLSLKFPFTPVSHNLSPLNVTPLGPMGTFPLHFLEEPITTAVTSSIYNSWQSQLIPIIALLVALLSLVCHFRSNPQVPLLKPLRALRRAHRRRRGVKRPRSESIQNEEQRQELNAETRNHIEINSTQPCAWGTQEV